MNSDVQSADECVLALVPSILEEMFYAEAHPDASSEYDWRATGPVWSRIELMAPLSGTLWVSVAGPLVSEWVEMAGASTGDLDAKKGLVGELANTVAGRLQIELAGEHGDVRVGLPRAGLGEARVDARGGRTWRFSVDGYPVAVALREAV